VLLRSFRANNYKSLKQTSVINLGPGINIVIGQNNVGKTALLEGIAGRATKAPHRSLTNSGIKQPSTFEFTFEIETSELKEWCRDRFPDPWFIYGGPPASNYEQRIYQLFARPFLEFRGVFTVDEGIRPSHWVCNGEAMPAAKMIPALVFTSREPPPLLFKSSRQIATNDGNLLEHQVVSLAMARFYMFRAERLNIHRHVVGVSTELNPDASNLPQVLDNLQSNPARYRRYVECVRRIFPHVHEIRVVSVGDNHKEIRAWMAPVETEREDLSFPLNNCGTGIGQVLAMLYVVLNSPEPRTLIIDEPNSFLHPGAVRELMRILQENPRHQYIVSTHSPTVADATRPSSVHVLSWANGETSVSSADLDAVESQRLILKEVGASFADVFGADRVLWVEGKTEEVCFPRLLAHFEMLAARTAIVGVLHTGDFDRRDADRVVSIYERLSSGALMPTQVAFLFDRESRTDQQRADLAKRCRGHVRFTNARMFENYLLHTGAVESVLRKALVDARVDIDETLLAKAVGSIPSDLADIDGAKLLGNIFSAVSGGRVPYEKVRHGAALLDEIIHIAPDHLKGIADEVMAALPP
jgi:predicted ATPase